MPAQPLPQEPDIQQIAQDLRHALSEFMEDLENARSKPHLVDSPQALEHLSNHIKNLHAVAIRAGG
ncbi:MAG: hypothetical protein P0S96_02100 [Simkaniaceae bacterium]|nr:hypothetical protein [Candidatus Sacchlamyda saccharinae]